MLRNMISKTKIEFDFSAEGKKIQINNNINNSPYRRQLLQPTALNRSKYSNSNSNDIVLFF